MLKERVWNAQHARCLIADLPLPPNYEDVEPEYVHGFESALAYAAELAAMLQAAIGEIERLNARRGPS